MKVGVDSKTRPHMKQELDAAIPERTPNDEYNATKMAPFPLHIGDPGNIAPNCFPPSKDFLLEHVTPSLPDAYVGLSDEDEEGEFRWSDDSTFDAALFPFHGFSSDADGEGNSDELDCVVVSGGGGDDEATLVYAPCKDAIKGNVICSG